MFFRPAVEQLEALIHPDSSLFAQVTNSVNSMAIGAFTEIMTLNKQLATSQQPPNDQPYYISIGNLNQYFSVSGYDSDGDSVGGDFDPNAVDGALTLSAIGPGIIDPNQIGVTPPPGSLPGPINYKMTLNWNNPGDGMLQQTTLVYTFDQDGNIVMSLSQQDHVITDQEWQIIMAYRQSYDVQVGLAPTITAIP